MSATEPSSTGLDQNVAGLLAYLLGPITGVLFLVLEKENQFVRFHAMQSTMAGVVTMIVWVALGVLGSILSVIPFLGWLVAGAVAVAAGVAILALWIVLMLRALQGHEWELPIIGSYARQYSSTATV